MLIYIILLVSILAGASAYPAQKFDGRIVNGTDANWGDCPYIVSIRSTFGSHGCGGVIIDPDWILTAAHCATRQPNQTSIQFGVLEISEQGPNLRNVQKVIRHENHNPETGENDIALMKLTDPIPMSEFVQIAKLPAQGQPTPGHSPAMLAGWGRSYTGGPVMIHLQKVDIRIFSHEECEAAHFIEIFHSNICAGIDEGGKGQCSGDSGGPLTVNGEVVGLVSWSIKPCTIKGYPGVFTRTSSFYDWIMTNTKN